jgi:uncharacterized protein
MMSVWLGRWRSPSSATFALGWAITVSAALAGLPGHLKAQTSEPKSTVITQDRLEATKEMMRAAGMDLRFRSVIDTIGAKLSAVLVERHPQFAKEIAETCSAVAERYHDRSGDAIALVAPLYAELLTLDELRQIHAFYTSPLGKKYVASHEHVLLRSHDLGAAWAERIAGLMQRDVVAEFSRRGIVLDPSAAKQ